MRVRLSRVGGGAATRRGPERAPPVYGELSIGWWISDPAVHRLVARTTTKPAPQGSAELLPPFADVLLVSATKRRMILRGVGTLKTARSKVEVCRSRLLARGWIERLRFNERLHITIRAEARKSTAGYLARTPLRPRLK
jgi:hypothetical protein